MTDRPILFSAPMVRALLEGRKTQTRRIVKPQPIFANGIYDNGDLHATLCSDGVWRIFDPNEAQAVSHPLKVRFAKGDRLWVRETFARVGFKEPEKIYYRADGEHQFMGEGRESNGNVTRYFTDCWERNGERQKGSAWKVSIHMPRWASRLTLTVTDVRVQRLWEINHADASAEGPQFAPHRAPPGGCTDDGGDPSGTDDCARCGFKLLWASINGGASWYANPWVVAVTFTVERRNIDA